MNAQVYPNEATYVLRACRLSESPTDVRSLNPPPTFPPPIPVLPASNSVLPPPPPRRRRRRPSFSISLLPTLDYALLLPHHIILLISPFLPSYLPIYPFLYPHHTPINYVSSHLALMRRHESRVHQGICMCICVCVCVLRVFQKPLFLYILYFYYYSFLFVVQQR